MFDDVAGPVGAHEVHSAAQPQRPRLRGGPKGLDEEHARRFDFCCRVEGCREPRPYGIGVSARAQAQLLAAELGSKTANSFSQTIRIEPEWFPVGFQKLILEPEKQRLQTGFARKCDLFAAMLVPLARQ